MGLTVTLGAGPQWSPGPKIGPCTVNWCWVNVVRAGGTEAGLGVEQGDITDTELVEAMVSDGVGLIWLVHTSVTGAAAGTWVGGALVDTTGAVVLVTVGELALSLLICDEVDNTHSY